MARPANRARRVIAGLPRPALVIPCRTWHVRTLHPFRRVVRDGVREPFTLDGVVRVSLPHLVFLDRVAA